MRYESGAHHLPDERRQVGCDAVHLLQKVTVERRAVLREVDHARGKCLDVHKVDRTDVLAHRGLGGRKDGRRLGKEAKRGKEQQAKKRGKSINPSQAKPSQAKPSRVKPSLQSYPVPAPIGLQFTLIDFTRVTVVPTFSSSCRISLTFSILSSEISLLSLIALATRTYW